MTHILGVQVLSSTSLVRTCQIRSLLDGPKNIGIEGKDTAILPYFDTYIDICITFDTVFISLPVPLLLLFSLVTVRLSSPRCLRPYGRRAAVPGWNNK